MQVHLFKTCLGENADLKTYSVCQNCLKKLNKKKWESSEVECVSNLHQVASGRLLKEYWTSQVRRKQLLSMWVWLVWPKTGYIYIYTSHLIFFEKCKSSVWHRKKCLVRRLCIFGGHTEDRKVKTDLGPQIIRNQYYIYIHPLAPFWGQCVSQGISDEKGVPQQPLINTVIKDLAKLGHSFSFQKVDARQYLLPQRRNRVFGCSFDKLHNTDEELQQQHEDWKRLFVQMGMVANEQRFTLQDVLEEGLEQQPLQSQQDIKNWKKVLAKAKQLNQEEENICMHMGSSDARREWANKATTCIRPTHDIFYGGAGRPLVASELLRLQGVFQSDFECPDALKELPETLAKDMAGNAFPTTVLQANLISSIIAHRQVWENLGKGSGSQASTEKVPAAKGTKRKAQDRKHHQEPKGKKQRKDEAQIEKKPSGDGPLGYTNSKH